MDLVSTYHYTVQGNTFDRQYLVNFHAVILQTSLGFKEVSQDLKQILDAKEDDTDLVTLSTDSKLLDIATIRELQTKLNVRKGENTTYIIEAQKFPMVSQNAFLKTLEDTPSSNRVIIVIKPGTRLLETVRSRVLLVELNQSSKNQESILANLIMLPLEVRLNKWEEVNKSGELGQIATELLADQKLLGSLSPIVIKTLIKLYQGWQQGEVLSKYFYEYICLQLPIVES